MPPPQPVPSFIYQQPVTLFPYGTPYMNGNPYYQPIAYFTPQPIMVPYQVFAVPNPQSSYPQFKPTRKCKCSSPSDI